MRVFAAIALPEDVVDDLRARLDAAPSTPQEPLRWTEPSSWHLTLAFFGTMPDSAVLDLRRRLTRTARRHRALRLRLAGSGQFGRRVLWTGVTGDVGELRRLAGSVTAAGRRAGADVDDRTRYRPHLTLARVSAHDGADPAPVRAAVSSAVERLRTYAGPEWTATAFTLVRSDLGAGEGGRARHTPLDTFPLRERPDVT